MARIHPREVADTQAFNAEHGARDTPRQARKARPSAGQLVDHPDGDESDVGVYVANEPQTKASTQEHPGKQAARASEELKDDDSADEAEVERMLSVESFTPTPSSAPTPEANVVPVAAQLHGAGRFPVIAGAAVGFAIAATAVRLYTQSDARCLVAECANGYPA
ncbi:hypothetical protein AURDEDRAFT_159464 [Auricularia subglabra TFB-10046 SS5]|nr:hypothetical protein AURDEDRAFT_159464 [Auricularia subglabra TFB-10046 SS5]